MGFPGGLNGKEPACNVGDLSSIPRLGRFPGEGNGCPLQYSSLENPIHRGAWWATVQGVAKSLTQLKDWLGNGRDTLPFTLQYCTCGFLHPVVSLLNPAHTFIKSPLLSSPPLPRMCHLYPARELTDTEVTHFSSCLRFARGSILFDNQLKSNSEPLFCQW